MLVAGGVLLAGCGGGAGSGGPQAAAPVIAAINGSASPVTLTESAIEVTGAGFGAQPGFVRMTQGPNILDVAPEDPVNWSDTSILIVVPEGDGTFSFSSPGIVAIAVFGPGGGSNALGLSIHGRVPFEPDELRWAQATAMPAPRRGHAAGAVENAAGDGAHVLVLGGNDGAGNVDTVWRAEMDREGALGAWTDGGTLPDARALHAAAMAVETNSVVPPGTAHLYLIGGQQGVGETGTNAVHVAAVDLATGSLGAWIRTEPLPEPLLGSRAVILFGWLHVVGGYSAGGSASRATYSARILVDGTLEPFTRGADLPVGVAFHGLAAFGGFLFVMMGDSGTIGDPFSAVGSAPIGRSFAASVHEGVVGGWSEQIVEDPRCRHVVLPAFKQPIVVGGTVAGVEALLGFTNPDGKLVRWQDVTGAALPGLDLFHAAAITSPVLTEDGTQRHLILGGDSLASPGTPTAAVTRSTAP